MYSMSQYYPDTKTRQRKTQKKLWTIITYEYGHTHKNPQQNTSKANPATC